MTQYDGDCIIVRCPRCGSFYASGSVYGYLSPERSDLTDYKRAVLSHEVRKMQRHASLPTLTTNIMNNCFEHELPAPAERGNNLIIWLGENGRKNPGNYLQPVYDELIGILGCMTANDVDYVAKSLLDQKLVEGSTDGGSGTLRLLFKGWERYDQLLRGDFVSRTAFMAMPFNNPLLDHVYKDIWRPAVKRAGFDLVRIDDEPKAGVIDNHLRVEIRKARFVIAELTCGNHGAYWEAGFSEGLDRKVIYTCERAFFDLHRTHFDTNHCTTIIWEEDGLEEAGRKLTDTIRATLPGEAKQTDD
ncbi:MAG: hypothetical protein HQL44_09385 [Alphaproteobacteria bacterium]|nr:hypothetical protein [Alphaproteobacteria bacterium]